MFACLIKKGANVAVLQVSPVGVPKTTEIQMPEEKMYFEDDVTIDPLGKFPGAVGPVHDHVIGGRIAKRGFYGFKYQYEGKEATLLARPNDNDIIVV